MQRRAQCRAQQRVIVALDPRLDINDATGMVRTQPEWFGRNRTRFLLSPVASLNLQSVDSMPSCEACLCRANFEYEVSWVRTLELR